MTTHCRNHSPNPCAPRPDLATALIHRDECEQAPIARPQGWHRRRMHGSLAALWAENRPGPPLCMGRQTQSVIDQDMSTSAARGANSMMHAAAWDWRCSWLSLSPGHATARSTRMKVAWWRPKPPGESAIRQGVSRPSARASSTGTARTGAGGGRRAEGGEGCGRSSHGPRSADCPEGTTSRVAATQCAGGSTRKPPPCTMNHTSLRNAGVYRSAVRFTGQISESLGMPGWPLTEGSRAGPWPAGPQFSEPGHHQLPAPLLAEEAGWNGG